MTIKKIYPYPIPADVDPWAALLINAGNRILLDLEGLKALAQHLRDVGFTHHGDQETRHHHILSVGTSDPNATLSVTPGDTIDWEIPEHHQSCVWIDGDAPTSLTIQDGHLRGRCAVLGTWTFDIVIGPRIKYDSPLAGAPLEPGQWIPITQRRKPQATTPDIDLTAMTPIQLDALITQAQAAKENPT